MGTNDRLTKPRSAVQRERLVGLATRLVGIPSPTGEAGEVLESLAEFLQGEGFAVERREAGHAKAPAVVARLDSGRPGRILQFNGHLDTVHLPFVPPTVEGDLIRGSGASDMKAGTAAAVEALLALRDSGLLTAGSVLLTAHDLHEAPWGDGSQLDRLIHEGVVGDAVLLPEPLHDRLPVIGRGLACWKATVRRPGTPVHEVMRPADEPSVLAAGADLIGRLERLNERLAREGDSLAGRASAFVGQFHGGEIFNQYPQEAWLEGTRRWLPGTAREDVEAEFRTLVDELARDRGVGVDLRYQVVRDAFRLEESDPFVAAFQEAYSAIGGAPLAIGPKPFVDDGNSFWAHAGIPAITHGPRAGGQHTVEEWVSIDDLTRVARLYALIASSYCDG